MADRRDTGSASLLLIGKLLLGLGLIVVIVILASGLRQQEAPPAFSEDEHPQPGLVTQPPGSNGVPATVLSPLEQARAAKGFLSAETVLPKITVYSAPSAQSKALKTFANRDKYDMPATFLVNQENRDDAGEMWYRVLVPMRPTGTMGWVRASEVQASVLTHSIRISLSKHRLQLYDRGTLVKTYPVGVGKAGTRTPTGEFYFTTKLRPSNPKTVYGVLAIGLSAFSETLTDWPDGGQVGIHGTNNDAGIGKDVSAGCIRMHNADIVEMNELTPLGTPVFIEQ